MRQGEPSWRPFGRRGGENSRPDRAARPGGAETGLERRDLLSLGVATFPVPAVAPVHQDVTKGPDGAVWFTEPGKGKVGKITPSGQVTEFALPAGYDASGAIISGPDGNLWIGQTNAIGRVTPGGKVTEFPLDPSAHVTGLAPGPDGNVWYLDTSRDAIGRVTPHGDVTEFPIPPAMSETTSDHVTLVHDLTAGPDGNLWYTAEVYNHRLRSEAGEIGRVTPDGQVTTYLIRGMPPGSRPARGSSHLRPTGGMLADAITAGPDGNLWFTEHQQNGVSGVGRITPDGTITQYAIPATPAGAKLPSISTDIEPGPDGNLWFNLATDDFLGGPTPGPYVGRVTTKGRVVVFTLPNATDTQGALLVDGLDSLTPGPDHNIWFAGITRRYTSPTGRVIGTITPPKE